MTAESLGKTLKKIRESKHLSLEEVSEKTRIPKKIISAMEEDRLHEVSSPFYVRGFIRTYARFLDALEEKKVIEYLSTGEIKKPTPQLLLKSEKVPGDLLIKYKKHIARAALVIFGAYLVIFSFIRIGRFMRNACVRYKASISERKKSQDAKVAMKPLQKKKEDSVLKAATIDKKTKGVELEIIARYNTWIQVESDGKLTFRGALRRGTSDIWRAKKEIRLELGNAGGVTLSVNGEDLGAPGKKGEKKKIIITEEGIKD